MASAASKIESAEPDLRRVRFDRNELAGSFGDIGTDLPLIVAMIPAAGLDPANVFVVFGLLQILTGMVYGVPMPMQPLKAMAVLVITQNISGPVVFGAGLAIAAIMLILSVAGLLTWLARVIPRCVVRGIQLGLGLKLAWLALKDYVPSLGLNGYVLAGVCFVLIVVLWRNRRLPAALPVIGLGVVYAAAAGVQWGDFKLADGVWLPAVKMPAWDAVWTGLLVLAIPQLPLSLSNSVIATDQTLRDLFPARAIGVRRIGITYGVANVFASMLGGVPVCHGCGGLAGHYAFGARTGGSVVIYGLMYVGLGLLLGGAVGSFVAAYPKPVLGVVLLFESVTLMLLVRDTTNHALQFTIVLLVGVIAFGVTQGFVVGLLVGTAVWYFWKWSESSKNNSR